MTKPEIFREYIWMVGTIYEAGEITLAELAEKWRNCDFSYGREMSRTSFKRHKAAIADVFGVDIECDLSNGYKYHIANKEILGSDTIQRWLVSTMSVNTLMSDNMDLKDRIVLEEVAIAGRKLEMVVAALKENVAVRVGYRKFGQDTTSEYELEPYALKLFGKRWYMIAHSQRHDIAVYSLDRIEEMELTERRFEMNEEFDVRKIFQDCYGVIIGDGTKKEKIVLDVYGKERYYIESLPLHHTQKEVSRSEDSIRYQYELKPTYDFKQAILSRGAEVVVVEPAELRSEIAAMLRNALERYK